MCPVHSFDKEGNENDTMLAISVTHSYVVVVGRCFKCILLAIIAIQLITTLLRVWRKWPQATSDYYIPSAVLIVG